LKKDFSVFETFVADRPLDRCVGPLANFRTPSRNAFHRWSAYRREGAAWVFGRLLVSVVGVPLYRWKGLR